LGFDEATLSDAIYNTFVALLRGNTIPRNPTFALLVHILRTKSEPLDENAVLESLRGHLDTGASLLDSNLVQLRAAWADMVPRMRILCVSAVNDSLPMWAHYCDNHKGVVLKLAANDEGDSSLLLAEPVLYSSAKPQLPGVDLWAAAVLGEREIVWMEYFREYYYVKSMSWQYEDEWRVISFARTGETGDYYDSPLDRRDVLGIYLGKDMSSTDKVEFRAIASETYPHAEVFEARADLDARRIVFTPVE